MNKVAIVLLAAGVGLLGTGVVLYGTDGATGVCKSMLADAKRNIEASSQVAGTADEMVLLQQAQDSMDIAASYCDESRTTKQLANLSLVGGVLLLVGGFMTRRRKPAPVATG